MQRLMILLAGGALLGGAGCATSGELMTAITPGQVKTKVSDSPRVSRIVCLWEPGSGNLPNGPKRGVLGQILFFHNKDDAPIEVDGKVTVYLFDNHGTIEEQTKPVQKLVLTSKDLQATHVDAAIGHSYHIPVPYVRDNDGLASTCTMRVKYTSPEGRVVYSDLSSVYLEGKQVPSNGLSTERVTAAVGESKRVGDKPSIQQTTVRKTGNAEIRQVEAGPERLKSLTIRRELPKKRRQPAAVRQIAPPREQPRKRFHLSNSASEQQGVTADDFAPLD